MAWYERASAVLSGKGFLMAGFDYATPAHRDGDQAGWYLDDHLLSGPEHQTLRDLLCTLLRQGWEIMLVCATTCTLRRSKPGTQPLC